MGIYSLHHLSSLQIAMEVELLKPFVTVDAYDSDDEEETVAGDEEADDDEEAPVRETDDDILALIAKFETLTLSENTLKITRNDQVPVVESSTKIVTCDDNDDAPLIETCVKYTMIISDDETITRDDQVPIVETSATKSAIIVSDDAATKTQEELLALQKCARGASATLRANLLRDVLNRQEVVVPEPITPTHNETALVIYSHTPCPSPSPVVVEAADLHVPCFLIWIINEICLLMQYRQQQQQQVWNSLKNSWRTHGGVASLFGIVLPKKLWENAVAVSTEITPAISSSICTTVQSMTTTVDYQPAKEDICEIVLVIGNTHSTDAKQSLPHFEPGEKTNVLLRKLISERVTTTDECLFDYTEEVIAFTITAMPDGQLKISNYTRKVLRDMHPSYYDFDTEAFPCTAEWCCPDEEDYPFQGYVPSAKDSPAEVSGDSALDDEDDENFPEPVETIDEIPTEDLEDYEPEPVESDNEDDESVPEPVESLDGYQPNDPNHWFDEEYDEPDPVESDDEDDESIPEPVESLDGYQPNDTNHWFDEEYDEPDPVESDDDDDDDDESIPEPVESLDGYQPNDTSHWYDEDYDVPDPVESDDDESIPEPVESLDGYQPGDEDHWYDEEYDAPDPVEFDRPPVRFIEYPVLKLLTDGIGHDKHPHSGAMPLACIEFPVLMLLTDGPGHDEDHQSSELSVQSVEPPVLLLLTDGTEHDEDHRSSALQVHSCELPVLLLLTDGTEHNEDHHNSDKEKDEPRNQLIGRSRYRFAEDEDDDSNGIEEEKDGPQNQPTGRSRYWFEEHDDDDDDDDDNDNEDASSLPTFTTDEEIHQNNLSVTSRVWSKLRSCRTMLIFSIFLIWVTFSFQTSKVE